MADQVSPSLVVVRTLGGLHGAVQSLSMALAEALAAVDAGSPEPELVQAMSEAVHQCQQARAVLAEAALELRLVVHN